MTAPRELGFWTLLQRSLRLRCPVCGEGRIFGGWLKMNPKCSHCEFRFEREPGYFLGSIYFNYGLTALLVTILFFSLNLGAGVKADALLWSLTAFCVIFPLWFFRYARALWLGMDQYFDPHQPGSQQSQAVHRVKEP